MSKSENFDKAEVRKNITMVSVLDESDESTNYDDAPVETVVAVPKKRGRPTKPNKVAKVPSGRGRGRPKKELSSGGDRSPSTKKAVDNDGSPTLIITPGRGRPAKAGKPKVTHQIEATGRGRGRPKKVAAPINLINGKNGVRAGSAKSSSEKMGNSDKPKAGRGRPRKIAISDDDREDDNHMDTDDDEEEEYDTEDRRSVGRPATGAVNLNIERTGRGQGRPRKEDTLSSNAQKRRSDGNPSDGPVSPKKRGRPPLGGSKSISTPYKPTGKPRGRPKKTVVPEIDDDELDDNDEPIDNNDEELLGV